MLAEILQVQQLQRDASAPQFGVDLGRIGQRAGDSARDLRPVEPLFERVVGQPLERVPGQADSRSPGSSPMPPRRD